MFFFTKGLIEIRSLFKLRNRKNREEFSKNLHRFHGLDLSFQLYMDKLHFQQMGSIQRLEPKTFSIVLHGGFGPQVL